MAEQSSVKNMRILVRRDKAENWNRYNPVLLIGEQGYETDLGGLKFGDGVRRWKDLPYFAGFTGIDGGSPATQWPVDMYK